MVPSYFHYKDKNDPNILLKFSLWRHADLEQLDNNSFYTTVSFLFSL